MVVEGLISPALHKSPHKGFSIEFAEHREYTPGVDPRHIDWRVLGRRDKLYVKQYEEETSLRCYLLLDKSASMGYKSDGAAPCPSWNTLPTWPPAWPISSRSSTMRPGSVTFDAAVRDQIPGRARVRDLFLRVLMEKLEQTQAGAETALSKVFHELAGVAEAPLDGRDPVRPVRRPRRAGQRSSTSGTRNTRCWCCRSSTPRS